MTKTILRRIFVASLLLGGVAQAQPKPPPEPIRVIGSSTVAPFVLGVGGLVSNRMRVMVSDTGTRAGIAALCHNEGVPLDVTGASRELLDTEISACGAHGAEALVEISLGLDGIVLAQAEDADELALTPKDLYLGLAQNVPRSETECVMVRNKATHWSDVRADLPHRPILFIGPPPSSGTRSMFSKLVLEAGAREVRCLGAVADRSPAFFDAALTIRSDGHWVDGGENDHAIAHALKYIDHAIGLFGFSHLQETSGIQAIPLSGVLPSAETIRNGSYPAVRPLFLYAVESRLADRPAVAQFLARFLTPEALAPNGVLTGLGLVSSPITGEVHRISTGTGERIPVDGGLEVYLSPPS